MQDLIGDGGGAGKPTKSDSQRMAQPSHFIMSHNTTFATLNQKVAQPSRRFENSF
jgi:hypothetical protein